MESFETTNSPHGIRLQPFTLTVEDMLSISWRKAVRPMALFVSLASLLVGSILVEYSRAMYDSHPEYCWLATPIVFLICWLGIRYGSFPKRLERQLKNAKLGERQVVLDPKAISWSVACGIESTVPWKAIASVESDAQRFVITLPGGQFFVIPRRALDQDSEHYLVDRLREAQKLP